MNCLRGLKFNPLSGLTADRKTLVDSKERKNSLVITNGPTFLCIYRLKPINVGAVQMTLSRVSLPIYDLIGLKILAG